MNKWPSILCAVHCALAPFLSLLVGSSLAHSPVMETLETGLIVVVFAVLLRTLVRVRGQLHGLFVVGVAISMALLLSVLFLPHGFVAACMIVVATFQIFADRKLCHTCHAS